jgi:hypothetical protein
MARDSRGILLKEGDQVILEIPSTLVSGEVHSITGGGIVTGIKRGGEDVQMGTVTILVAFKVSCHPQQPIIPNLHKLEQIGPVVVKEERKLIELN